MRITNLNCSDDIGASAWMVEIENHRILLDCGCHPKKDGLEALPLLSQFKHAEVDAIAISHCHHDHVGALPLAVRQFPKAHVLMTELSSCLVERVLHNSVNVMNRQREESGLLEYPLYTHAELDAMAHTFQGFGYNREIEWAAFHKTRVSTHSPTLEFYDAGHALGSAGIMLRNARKSLFFTGDVSFRDQTILRGARFDGVKAEVLIMETTRGNREVHAGFTRSAEILRLAQSIQKVIARRGCVLIPVFALGRTQEILAQLALLMNEGLIAKQPIYIGGLGRVFTQIYDSQSHRTHRHLAGLSLAQAHNLIVVEKKELEKMKFRGDKLFVITAGMMTEHTAAHDLAAQMIGDPRHGIFFVGYADPNTPGGRLKAARAGETFLFSGSAGLVTKNCEVDDFDLTAHANREELVDFVEQVSPRCVILGHGEPESKAWFEETLRQRYPSITVLNPAPGQSLTV